MTDTRDDGPKGEFDRRADASTSPNSSMTASIALAVLSVACGKDAAPSSGRPQLEELRAQLAPSHTMWDRAVAAGRLASMCCPHRSDFWGSDAHPTRQTPESTEACQDLRSLLERERDEQVLRSAMGNWGPACYESEISPSLLAKVLDRSGLELEVRVRIADHLRVMDPTPETVDALVAQLGTPDEALRYRVAFALGSYGELELVTVVRALDDNDVRVAGGAAVALTDALSHAPLDIPELGPALDRKTAAWDGTMGAHARSAARNYRESLSHQPDVLAKELLEHPEFALRAFAVRRAFCTSKVADDAIARLRNSEDKEVASVARRAGALRDARCK